MGQRSEILVTEIFDTSSESQSSASDTVRLRRVDGRLHKCIFASVSYFRSTTPARNLLLCNMSRSRKSSSIRLDTFWNTASEADEMAENSKMTSSLDPSNEFRSHHTPDW